MGAERTDNPQPCRRRTQQGLAAPDCQTITLGYWFGYYRRTAQYQSMQSALRNELLNGV